MNVIKFVHNWNDKLGKDIFTTIRKYEYKKLEYYEGCVGNTFLVLLKNQKYSTAKLIEVERIAKFIDVNKGMVCSDTGMEYKEAVKVFKKFGIEDDTQIILLTFKNTTQFNEEEQPDTHENAGDRD